MILTDDEIRQVRSVIEAQAGLDEELVRRCGHMIRIAAFDEAVRSAFILLEERLRKAVDQEGMSGTQLANYAFSPGKGPLAKHLASSPSEQEGLRELYSGAFKLFRNPTAHGVVGYSPAEGRAIIALVDLMLKLVERVEELPPPGFIPENVAKLLDSAEQKAGPGATSRLRSFVARCQRIGLQPSNSTKVWIPFRKHAQVKQSGWDEPKPRPTPVFYLGKEQLEIPLAGCFSSIVGFDPEPFRDELLKLGFIPSGKKQEPLISWLQRNDQAFFDALLDIVGRIAGKMDASLQE